MSIAPKLNDVEADGGAPRALRYAFFGLLGLVVLGAVYLIIVRGPAILVDLGTLAGKVWCF